MPPSNNLLQASHPRGRNQPCASRVSSAARSPPFAVAPTVEEEIIIISSDDDNELPPTKTRRGAVPTKRAHPSSSSEKTQEVNELLRMRNLALEAENQELKKTNHALSQRTRHLDRQYQDVAAEMRRLTDELADAKAEMLVSQTAAESPSKLFVTELDDIVSCEICTSLMWSPYTIACGHTFCQTCLSDWFSTALAQHIAAHPDWQPPRRAALGLAGGLPRIHPVAQGIRANAAGQWPAHQVHNHGGNPARRALGGAAGGEGMPDVWADVDNAFWGAPGGDEWGAGGLNRWGVPVPEDDILWPGAGGVNPVPHPRRMLNVFNPRAGALPPPFGLNVGRGGAGVGADAQPDYTCPTCRAPVKAKPAENFVVKRIVAAVAKAQGDTNPEHAGGNAVPRPGVGPWEGFWPE